MLWQLFSEEKIDNIALVPEEEYSIKEVSITVQELTGLKGCDFDTTKADGQFKKTMGNKLLKSYLPNFKFTSLRDGLKVTIEDFAANTEQRL
jgi:GDP-L-fucose synthase